MGSTGSGSVSRKTPVSTVLYQKKEGSGLAQVGQTARITSPFGRVDALINASLPAINAQGGGPVHRTCLLLEIMIQSVC